MRKKKLLFVYVDYSTFVKTDYEILASSAEVVRYQFAPGKGVFSTGLKLLKQFFFLLLNSWRFDTIYVWFADYHSLLPVIFAKLLRKKSLVVIGGYDICRDRSLKYGSFCSPIRGFFTAQTIRNSSLNLTVSKYIDRKVGFVFSAVKHHLIYNCIAIEAPQNQIVEKEKLVLCVALLDSKKTYLRKGVDTFLSLSSLLPDYQFILVGPSRSAMSLFPAHLPANVLILERVPHPHLIDYFQRASYYCQLSRIEIFGVAIGESMLHRCIPFVTNEGGMPEVVGKEGEIVPRNAEAIANRMRQLEAEETTQKREDCRQRVLTYFSVANRQEAINQVL